MANEINEAVAATNEVLNEALIASAPTSFEAGPALPSGKVNLNLPAVGVGVLIGGLAIGAGYGCYKLIVYLKGKKTKEAQNDTGDKA